MTDFVTERELRANLDPMRDDISEIKADVKTILTSQYEHSFLGGRGHALLIVAIPTLLSITAAVLIALFL